MELHEQLTPTKVYSAYKTRTSTLNDVKKNGNVSDSDWYPWDIIKPAGLENNNILKRKGVQKKKN